MTDSTDQPVYDTQPVLTPVPDPVVAAPVPDPVPAPVSVPDVKSGIPHDAEVLGVEVGLLTDIVTQLGSALDPYLQVGDPWSPVGLDLMPGKSPIGNQLISAILQVNQARQMIAHLISVLDQ